MTESGLTSAQPAAAGRKSGRCRPTVEKQFRSRGIPVTAARIARRQISLLHEGVAWSCDRLESLGGWKSRNESSRFCAWRRQVGCGERGDLLLQNPRQPGTQRHLLLRIRHGPDQKNGDY